MNTNTLSEAAQNLNLQDCKNIARLMLNDRWKADTVYKMVLGHRTMSPLVQDAIEAYCEEKITASIVYQEHMQQCYARFRRYNMLDGGTIASSREAYVQEADIQHREAETYHHHAAAISCEEEAETQVHPKQGAYDARDLTPAMLVANNRGAIQANS
jgi:hypothetical protein